MAKAAPWDTDAPEWVTPRFMGASAATLGPTRQSVSQTHAVHRERQPKFLRRPLPTLSLSASRGERRRLRRLFLLGRLGGRLRAAVEVVELGLHLRQALVEDALDAPGL